MEIDLKLATATANWNKGEHNDNWTVRDNKGNLLFILQAEFNEKSAMQAIRLARQAELESFNTGVEYGKELQEKVSKGQLEHAASTVRSLAIMNENLSEQLEKEINKQP